MKTIYVLVIVMKYGLGRVIDQKFWDHNVKNINWHYSSLSKIYFFSLTKIKDTQASEFLSPCWVQRYMLGLLIYTHTKRTREIFMLYFMTASYTPDSDEGIFIEDVIYGIMNY